MGPPARVLVNLMPRTLSDAAGGTSDFLVEAEKRAEAETGIAPMLAAFAVEGALSEATAGGVLSTPRLFRLFLNKMKDVSSWLRSPPARRRHGKRCLAC